ncbi:MAG: sulfite exporter TauE/SafE family protein [Candidatus Omnitrophica bacterium]|nr:sulfite exporter TauE/SafE family protein [Candidatus Omnitrophota bacterium]
MPALIICLASFLASGLTLFSGFGLGTLLMPVMALFFPLTTAIALTAIVHLLNNLFKLVLLGKKADQKVLLRFGIPAVLSAPIGAWFLFVLADLPSMARYHLWGAERVVTPVKCAVAVLMAGFAAMELLPRFQKLSFPVRFLPLGGIVTGFFGGLSGHQGAFRSAFLIRSGLPKESFIATGVVTAVLVDFSRIFVYAGHFQKESWGAAPGLLAAATLSAFAGAWLAARFLHKVTLRWIQILIAVLLVGIAGGLATGLL